MPPGDARVRALDNHVLAWLEGERRGRTTGPITIRSLVRAHATQEGYAVAACCPLRLADLPAVERLARQLIVWLWPDGGWNCDRNPQASHSSFHETHGPLWGLAEFHRSTGDRDAGASAARAAEFLLHHQLFRSDKSGRVIDNGWLRLRFPPYWHYDVLQGLWVLTRAGQVGDPRGGEALDFLLWRRHPDGTWRADGYHWKAPGGTG